MVYVEACSRREGQLAVPTLEGLDVLVNVLVRLEVVALPKGLITVLALVAGGV